MFVESYTSDSPLWAKYQENHGIVAVSVWQDYGENGIPYWLVVFATTEDGTEGWPDRTRPHEQQFTCNIRATLLATKFNLPYAGIIA